MITTHQVQQGSDEWKEARVGKYTGSNAYKLLSSFGATEYAKAINDSFTGNFHTERGHILEEEAVDLYETIKGVAVDRQDLLLTVSILLVYIALTVFMMIILLK